MDLILSGFIDFGCLGSSYSGKQDDKSKSPKKQRGEYMRKITFIASFNLIILSITNFAYADRDWEYWSRYSFDVSITKQISYLVKPEWRIKDDMTDKYLFKLEQAIAFQINKYVDTHGHSPWHSK